MRHARRVAASAFMLVAALFVAGCAGQYTVFGPTEGATVKPGSLAVVCGLGDELTVAFAQQVTQELQADSKFIVTPQKQITAKFSSYPTTIIDDPAKFSDADRSKFDKIQKGLGVDYILVLWTYNSGSQSGSAVLGTNLHFSVGGRLLAYPGARDAGMSDFAYEMGQLFKSQEETTHQMIVNASHELVTEFLKKTGTSKEN